jgi:hypothetical protein
MTEFETFLQLVHASFPTEPVPRRFFRTDGEPILEPDPEQLQSRMQHRRWTEVTLMDWLMTVTPHVVKYYLEPSTYLYYLPSLLVGVFDDPGYSDWGVEAILPDNKWHKPRGKWWTSFRGCVSEQQRITLWAFLTAIRAVHGETIDPGLEAGVADAERIWQS